MLSMNLKIIINFIDTGTSESSCPQTLTMDQPQSSQSSFSDPSATAQGPVPLFDIHLRYLTDSYLTFFQERQVLALIYLI
jgi:hypothetical protein